MGGDNARDADHAWEVRVVRADEIELFSMRATQHLMTSYLKLAPKTGFSTSKLKKHKKKSQEEEE